MALQILRLKHSLGIPNSTAATLAALIYGEGRK